MGPLLTLAETARKTTHLLEKRDGTRVVYHLHQIAAALNETDGAPVTDESGLDDEDNMEAAASSRTNITLRQAVETAE